MINIFKSIKEAEFKKNQQKLHRPTFWLIQLYSQNILDYYWGFFVYTSHILRIPACLLSFSVSSGRCQGSSFRFCLCCIYCMTAAPCYWSCTNGENMEACKRWKCWLFIYINTYHTWKFTCLQLLILGFFKKPNNKQQIPKSSSLQSLLQLQI